MRKTGEDPKAAQKAGARVMHEAKLTTRTAARQARATARQVGQALLTSSLGKKLHKRGWASV
jgi:hypothetical protein